jgi:hypothetical protein
MPRRGEDKKKGSSSTKVDLVPKETGKNLKKALPPQADVERKTAEKKTQPDEQRAPSRNMRFVAVERQKMERKSSEAEMGIQIEKKCGSTCLA